MNLDPNICSEILLIIIGLFIFCTLVFTVLFYRYIYDIIPDKDKNTDIGKWSPYIFLFLILLFIVYDSIIAIIIFFVECLNSLTIFSSPLSKLFILCISFVSLFGVVWSIRSDMTNYYEKMENNNIKNKYENIKLELDKCQQNYSSEISKLKREKKKLNEENQSYISLIDSASINIIDVKMLYLHQEFKKMLIVH